LLKTNQPSLLEHLNVVSHHTAKDKERYTTHCLCKNLHINFIDIQGEDLKRKKGRRSQHNTENYGKMCGKLLDNLKSTTYSDVDKDAERYPKTTENQRGRS